MTDNKERKAFEAAWEKTYPAHGDSAFHRSAIVPGGYTSTRVNSGWEMWQARADLAAPQEKVEAMPLAIPKFKRYDADGKEDPHGALVFFSDVVEAVGMLEIPVAAQASEPVRWWSGMLDHGFDSVSMSEDTHHDIPLYAGVNHCNFAAQPSTEAVRNAALEEAAALCESEICSCCWDEEAQSAAEHLAEHIRDLKSAPPQPAEQPDAKGERIEALRKSLFETRDALSVAAGWVSKSDPAGHGWAVRMVDRANAVLGGEQPAEQPDPCPQCVPGAVCKTPTCGRLKTMPAVQPSEARVVRKISENSPLVKAIRAMHENGYALRTPESVTMKDRHFVCMGNGGISDENFDFDASLHVGGDFGDPAVKAAYCQMICDTLNASPAAPGAQGLKDHEVREAINQVRDIAIAFHADQQLRARIAGVLMPILARATPSAQRGE